MDDHQKQHKETELIRKRIYKADGKNSVKER